MPAGGRIEPLREGDDVLGWTVLETPGHTAGHISILDEPASVIFIGDLAGSSDGRAVHGPPAFTADRERSDRSLQRIADLEIARVLFSHGPELADPNGGMRRLLDGDPR